METLHSCPVWDPDLLEILSHIGPDSGIDWTLLWRDPQPQWVSSGGRVVQLGDSAHSFLPTSGNGATQAMEDALSLARCLRIAGKARVDVATSVHTKLRIERVSLLQKSGFRTRAHAHHIDLDAVEANPGVLDFRHHEWARGHDPVDYAERNYEAAERHVLDGAPFENTNTPPGEKYEPWTIAGEMATEKAAIQAGKTTAK